MLDHHIQKSVVYTLALASSMRFSDLKPAEIDNKLFDYHLKKVIAAKLVQKNDVGEYELTSKGRRVGKDAVKHTDFLIDRAYSVLFLAIRRSTDGAWLLCRRKTHPLRGKVGFMHAQPDIAVTAVQTAEQTAVQKTGLKCTFTVRGSGYLRMNQHESMESFTHFTVLESVDAHGELLQKDELAEYYWQDSFDAMDTALLPSIPYFVDELAKSGLFYLERTFDA